MVENSSKPWTSEEEDRLRELVISNAAAFDIAAELGRTVSAVKARAQVGRQVVLHDPDARGIGIMDIDEFAHALGVVFRRPPPAAR